jgi:DNA-binding CsgD family transcriptional regulator
MLMIAEPDAAPPTDFERIRRLYRLAPAESRLAQALLAGGGLKRAAEAAGMTYETARWYLKILFQKTGTSRQAELVALLLGDLAVPWKGRRDDA